MHDNFGNFASTFFFFLIFSTYIIKIKYQGKKKKYNFNAIQGVLILKGFKHSKRRLSMAFEIFNRLLCYIV